MSATQHIMRDEQEKACEDVQVVINVECPVHVEWPITGKPNGNEKKGT